MKYILTLVIISIFFGTVIWNKKSKKFVPPGTVPLCDSLFIDEHEVRNADYREFIYRNSRIFKDYPEVTAKLMPDTTVWQEYISFNDPVSQNYFRYPSYRDYPVVGVTYAQAAEYCRWRSDRVYEWLLIREGIVYPNPDQNADNYFTKEKFSKGEYTGAKRNILPENLNIPVPLYRLPSEQEWEYAASGGLDVKTFEYGYEKFDPFKIGINVKEFHHSNKDSIPPTYPAFSSKPNKYKIKHMIGNVAEMILEESIAKGGSFIYSLEECKVTNRINYNKPSYWLGFRCVCVIK